jgi:hypothetical protein
VALGKRLYERVVIVFKSKAVPAKDLQTDPLPPTGNSGPESLCLDYQDLILAGFESGLTAQRIYRMSNATQHA